VKIFDRVIRLTCGEDVSIEYWKVTDGQNDGRRTNDQNCYINISAIKRVYFLPHGVEWCHGVVTRGEKSDV